MSFPGMSLESTDLLARREVPNVDEPVLAARDQPLAIRRHSGSGQGRGVDREDFGAVLYRPNADPTVRPCRHRFLAPRQKSDEHRIDASLLEYGPAFARLEIP